MALDGFFTATITIAVAAIVFLYVVIWKKSTDRIKELEGVEGQEGTIWLGDIWTTDIKGDVEEFYYYLQSSINELTSPDKFLELFTNTGETPTLRKKIRALTKSYKRYSDCRALFASSRNGHETTKNWILKTIFALFAIAMWGAVGFLIENTFLSQFTQIFWTILVILIVLLIGFAYNLANWYAKCNRIDSAIKSERSKHSDILGKVL